MKIRYHSDLHTESFTPDTASCLNMLISHINDEHEMILVLAGDIISYINRWVDTPRDIYTPWLIDLIERHKAVIMVPGNHEYYGGNLNTTIIDYALKFRNYSNFYILSNERVIIDGVVFIGSTKWTEISPRNSLIKSNDFVCIESMSVPKWNFMYNNSKQFLIDELDRFKNDTVVVITHFAPSFQSVHENYKFSNYNHLFCSNEEHIMFDYSPQLWIHGHVHNSMNYEVIDYNDVKCTQVVCNPRGYDFMDVNKFYDPSIVLTL